MILENIPGSAYEYRLKWDALHDFATFERLRQPLTDPKLRCYVSPDRAEHYRKLPCGLYEALEVRTAGPLQPPTTPREIRATPWGTLAG